ncbi:unnamed protein product [Calypogeia fissa]
MEGREPHQSRANDMEQDGSEFSNQTKVLTSSEVRKHLRLARELEESICSLTWLAQNAIGLLSTSRTNGRPRTCFSCKLFQLPPTDSVYRTEWMTSTYNADFDGDEMMVLLAQDVVFGLN